MSGRNFPLPRGMRDIWMEEMAQRTWINKKILEVFDRYGFQLVEPSPIESLETLEAKCGSAVRDEIYWFEDKAGRKLGLRFDLTVGLARMVSNRPDLALPIKLGAISNMWRYDEPQHGRYRCFYQWDAEIFGSVEPEADAEIISLSMDVLENIGLKTFEVKISNRKLVEGFLEEIEIKDLDRIEAVLRIIDKYRKISKEEFTEELKKLGLDKTQIEKIFMFISIGGTSEEFTKKISEISWRNIKIEKGLEELGRLFDDLKSFKKAGKCILDMSIVRGIGYYDGIVFEIYDKAGEEIGAIVAGGRYDGLCKIFGRDLPATGVAGGIERLMLSMKKANLLPSLEKPMKVFVVAVNQAVREKVLEVVGKLRSWGIPTEFDLRTRSLTKQLEYADKFGFPVTLIVGTRELEKGKVRIRDMKKREEKEVEIERLRDILSGHVNL